MTNTNETRIDLEEAIGHYPDPQPDRVLGGSISYGMSIEKVQKGDGSERFVVNHSTIDPYPNFATRLDSAREVATIEEARQIARDQLLHQLEGIEGFDRSKAEMFFVDKKTGVRRKI